MCGICGVLQVRGEPRPVTTQGALERMADVMTHRGPDDRGTFISDGAALGVRRLSIIDIEGGHQPMTNEDGVVIAVQNGELYNHAQLRSALRSDGHSFHTRCDTEVIPHLYEQHGVTFPAQLRGEFALAVWDTRRRCGVVARDRMGIKPLYYAEVGDLLVFASELKGVLASGLVGTDLDYDAVASYLSLGFFPGPSTPLRGVSKLLPAHSLVIQNSSVRTEPYWTLPYPDAKTSDRDERQLAAELLAELEEAVRVRLMSDVPLGAMLSGGLDSSVVVALMARNMDQPVKTFSVGFVEDERNELGDARLVAERFGTDHHELELSYRDEAISLPDLLWYLDEPLADLSALGFYAISRLASREVTVALCGQGADELLGGYPAHRNAALAGAWSRAPAVVRRAGTSAAPHAPRRFRRAATAVTLPDPVERYVVQASKLSPLQRARLFRGQLRSVPAGSVERVASRFLNGAGSAPSAETLYLYQQLGLVDDMLHYFDRASMANSLEVRVPFLDHQIVEFCATVPNNLKVRRLEQKRLLRVAAAGLVPDRIIKKRKIGFFNQAAAGWLRVQADGLVSDYLLRPDAAYAEMIDPKGVAELIRQTADPTGSPLLLALLMLEIWLQEYVPRALATPA
jgi:asparagine synthase (glutamine-hydrolysing)